MSTTAADPTSLENLFGLVVPPPVPWWPPAPGWFVVGGMVLVLGFWGACGRGDAGGLPRIGVPRLPNGGNSRPKPPTPGIER